MDGENLEFGFYMVGLEEKAITEDDDAWHFAGYGAVVGNRDLGGDCIVPGAMRKGLDRRKGRIRLHKMHEVYTPDGRLRPQVGLITDAVEDTKGLATEGDLLKVNNEAREIVSMLKPRGRKAVRGYNGLSIGYKTLKARKGTMDGLPTRFLEEIDVFEVSFVDEPMNPKADLTMIKAATRLVEDEWKSMDVREREACLRGLGLSEGLAKRFIRLEREASGENKGQREAGGGGQKMPDFAGLIRAGANALR